MTNENTCDAVNAWFNNYWFNSGFGHCRPCNFFPYSYQVTILEQDEGWEECQSEPFSDFAV